jgi:glycosyltransferase involved in cell wall biosynthesis
MLPRVSVIMPAYNVAAFLTEAVASVTSQRNCRWELLIVDDGSGDDTRHLAESLVAEHPDKLSLLRHPGGARRGISASRNLGLRHATGELIAWLDADDVVTPESLARRVSLLEAHPEIGMVCGNTAYWYSWTGRPEDAARDHLDQHRVTAGTSFAPPHLLTAWVRRSVGMPCICSVMVRRSLLEHVGGSEERFEGLFEDQVLFAKIALAAQVLFVDECWARYRRHDTSTCAIARQTGQEDDITRAYERWLSTYVADSNVSDEPLRRALRMQRFNRHRRHATQRVRNILRSLRPHVAGRAQG